jgi:hypothetical protein
MKDKAMLRLPLALSATLLGLLVGQAQAMQIDRIFTDSLNDIDTHDFDPSRLERFLVPDDVRGHGCTFYEDADGGGESWHKQVAWRVADLGNATVYSQYVTTVGEWWDDRISSMSCDETADVYCYAAVYPEPDKGGYEAIFWSDQGLFNLADWGYDDTISSFVVFCNLRHD